jgi:hypothetical protein
MANRYFTRVCAFFLPRPFFALSLLGRSVYISRFPSFLERSADLLAVLAADHPDVHRFDWSGFTDPPGWYVVDSVAFHRGGGIEIGDNVEYYDLSSLEIAAIVPSER